MSTTPPQYDVAAAAQLDSALSGVRAALQDLLNKRASLTKSDLGTADTRPYWLWSGRLRDAFDSDSKLRQDALRTLVGQLDTIKRQLGAERLSQLAQRKAT
jgi:hypothetical protein